MPPKWPKWHVFVVQGQHRAVSPGYVTKTPHVVTVFWPNPLLGICGSLAVLVGPEAGLAVCVSFSGWLKPSSQSLTHRKPVRTIEVTLDRSASWQAELHRLLHQVVVGDEEESTVQWGTKVEMAGQLQRRRHRPLRLGDPAGLFCWSSGRKKSKTRLSLGSWPRWSMLRRGLLWVSVTVPSRSRLNTR